MEAQLNTTWTGLLITLLEMKPVIYGKKLEILNSFGTTTMLGRQCCKDLNSQQKWEIAQELVNMLV